MTIYRILVVDDQRDMRRLLCSWLATLEAEVKITDVPSGEEAILVAARQKFDLLVADVRLAGISGVELARKARQRSPELRVIFVTGLTDPVTQRQMSEAQVDGIFYKPVAMEDFLYAVERLLGRAETVYTVEAPQHAPPLTANGGKASLPEASIGEQLAELRHKLGAVSAALLNERSEIVAQAGELPGDVAELAVLASLVSSLNSSSKASVLMGAEAPNNYLRASGAKYDLHVGQAGASLALVVVTRPEAAAMQPGAIESQMRSIGNQMRSALAGMEAQVEPEAARIPTKTSPGAEGEMINEPNLANLEAILGQAGQTRLNSLEIDKFWETMTETDGGDSVTGAGRLTYDQARRLGLTPEDQKK